MATSVYLHLDERRKKKDGTFPIVFRLVHNREHTSIPTGYAIPKKNWDSKFRKIKGNCKIIHNVSYVNSKLREKDSEYTNTIQTLLSEHRLYDLSLKQLKAELRLKPLGRFTFFTYTERVIKLLKDEGKIGSANLYVYTINFIKNYHGSDIPFSRIDKNMLEKLESRYLTFKDNKINGLSVYMRTIRTIFNRAISEGVIDTNCYPFRRSVFENNKYRIKKEKTRSRAIPKSHIKKIEEFESKRGSNMWHAKNYFLFSFYMRGINFVDMAFIKKNDIQDGVLTYKRSKTKRRIEVSINKKAQEILDYYWHETVNPGQLVFPIIKRTQSNELIRKDISNKRSTTNKYLRIIAREIGLDINLTTYVGRHSWATIADKAGIDRRIISKGLGHADLQTTNIYIDDLVLVDDLKKADEIIIK
jgi:integrase